MKFKKIEYTHEDFERVRNFLMDTYKEKSSNWFIERWNWCVYFDGSWLEILETWPSSVGLWTDEKDNIVGLVSSQGEINGDVFFQLKETFCSAALANEMVDFAFNNLSVEEGGQSRLYPRLNKAHRHLFLNLFKNKGLSFSGITEKIATMNLHGLLQIDLPKGFKCINANQFSAEERAVAHARAFSDSDSKELNLLSERTRAYKGLVRAVDYRPLFDVCIADSSGQIAAFATGWYEFQNNIGMLEPVGTIASYRGNNLGKMVVYECMNRLYEVGVRKVYVGSGQEFYKSIGFEIVDEVEIWEPIQDL